MEAYSKEMRRDVLAACDAGEGTQAVSASTRRRLQILTKP